MRDFVFVMFVGSATLVLAMVIQQQPIPQWFSVLGIFLMTLNFYLQWKEKKDAKEENSSV